MCVGIVRQAQWRCFSVNSICCIQLEMIMNNSYVFVKMCQTEKSLTSWQTKNWQDIIAGSRRFRLHRPIHIMDRHTSLLNTYKQGEEVLASDKRRDEAALRTWLGAGDPSLSLLGGFYKRLRAVSPHNAWVKTCKRNMKWDNWELQPPDREWRRKNARWDGAEDPLLLRTQGEELTESLTEPVLTVIVWTEDLFVDCCWQSERWNYLQIGSPEPG